ncbi:MAG: YbjN domain-containing protein [Rhodoplanes sp.]
MRRFIATMLAAVLSFALTQAASADDRIKGITPAQVADQLKTLGYRAEIVEGQAARPLVRTGAGGHTVLILFYDCSGDSCGSIQFYVGYRKTPKFTLAFVDRWNSERRYGKAYLNKTSGDLRFEYDIDLRGGVSAGSIKQGLLLYEGMLARLDEFIRAAPTAPETAAPVPGALGEIAGKARDAEALAAEGKFAEAVAALDSAAVTLWNKAPLTFRRVLWVAAPPEGFGAYNPRENNIYASGVKMIAYAEPLGFGWSQSGDIFRIELVTDIVVKDKDGKELLRQEKFQTLKIGSRVRNREFMATFSYTFEGIPRGEYIVDTLVRDLVTGKTGTFSLPFVVR